MHESDSILRLNLDLEKTFGKMAECVVVTRPDRRVIFLNDATETLFGYARADLLGKTSEHLYANPADYQSVGSHYSESLERGEGHKYAVDFRRKDGSIFTCEVVTAPLYEAGGKHLGYLFVGRDITDRLALEAQAEQASAILEDALQSISEGFAMYDHDDRLLVCNGNYREIYPESAQAMVPGATFQEILQFGLNNGQYDTGQLSQEEWMEARLTRHQKADGETIEQKLGDGRWLQISERRTLSNGIAGIRTDITELKATQKDLQDAYANIRILTDSLSCSISELALDGTCLFINDYGAKWFAAEARDLVGCQIRDLLPKEVLTKTADKFALALEGTRTEQEVLATYRDGLRRNVLVEYIPKITDSGETTGLIIFATDITERKKVETTLAELYSVTSTRDLSYDEKVQQILRIGCDHFDMPFGVISRVIEDNFAIKYAECPNGELSPGMSFPLGITYCSFTLAADGPVAIAHTAQSDVRLHPCYKNFALEAYIGAPLLVDGKPYGTINFTSPKPHARSFSNTDKEIIRQFADWVGNEIARQQDHQALMDAKVRLERIASTDDLTGILNRRAFLERAATEVARFRRTKVPFSVVLADIDRFKSINDTYGHAGGDDVLRRFADHVSSALRAVDVFGRVGGEEFCIILDSTHPAEALMVAERLRERIQKACYLPDHGGFVTCSMGIATILPDDIEFSSLLQRADSALYEAKRSGRNRCVQQSPEEAAASSA